MKATSGIFRWQADAERALQKLPSTGLRRDRMTLLVPGDAGKRGQRIPVSAAEPPGSGKVLGTVVGSAIGLAAGFWLGASIGRHVGAEGPMTAIVSWTAGMLALLGGTLGALGGGAIDDASGDGLPADEWFVYEDALRRGRSVVMAFPDDERTAERIRGLLVAAGAESIDEARRRWWIGLRSAEQEQYAARELVTRARPGKDRAISPERSEVLRFAGRTSKRPTDPA